MQQNLFAIALVAMATSLAGCMSPRTIQEIRADQAAALGMWEYRVRGSPALDQGTMRIHRQNGRLTARLRDASRGRLRAQVSVRDQWMELRLDQVRVSGRLENGSFRGSVTIPTWDVSTSQRARRRARLQAQGSLLAHRVNTSPRSGAAEEIGCAPLLRESNYVCSPLYP